MIFLEQLHSNLESGRRMLRLSIDPRTPFLGSSGVVLRTSVLIMGHVIRNLRTDRTGRDAGRTGRDGTQDDPD